MNQTNGLANLIGAIESGNGAKVAIALYKAGVDITALGVVRIFDNIPFKACATIVRDSMGQDTQETILRKMDIESQCADMFTIAWQQGVDSGLKNVQGDKALTRYAMDIVKQHREKLVSGKNPVKPKKQIIDSDTDADSDDEDSDESTVKPYNPAGKPSGLVKGQSFMFEGAGYRVNDVQANGQYRIHRTHGIGILKNEGATFQASGFHYRVTKFIGNDNGKFNAIQIATPIKPVKVESAKPTPKKTGKGKTQLSQEEIIAKVTAAVMASLNS